MEVDLRAPSLPLPMQSNSNTRRPPRRDVPTKGHKKGSGAGLSRAAVELRKSPSQPLSRETHKAVNSKGGASIAQAKPLVLATERRLGEAGKALRSRKGSVRELDRWDITPDGGSASREGRHFTVANVGHNGKIFLRPTVRPANQRYPQPQFTFPMTPPKTDGLDALAIHQGNGDDSSALLDGQWTPSTEQKRPSATNDQANHNLGTLWRATRHRRAMSESTIHDMASVAHESEAGVFKVVISKPPEDAKSREVEDLDLTVSPLLGVDIPSWRIGTPRFTLGGTPFIHGSSYAPTEDARSSHLSFLNRNSLLPESLSTSTQHPSPLSLSRANFPLPPTSNLLSPSPGRFQGPTRTTHFSTHIVIEPTMFDALTFKPFCNDRSIVRYSFSTGAVTAATPPRLVAEITSPSFLDYELLSDFFLTFRSYLETSDLLRMLIARLKWALSRDDETGMIVRVRAFVAIRHWILNYFVDDFVVDYNLRVTFCDQLNDFVRELSQNSSSRKVQLKILSELKKCWRRVCAQYWDGPDFDANLEADIPIAPGGIAGHRNPSLDPSFWESDNDKAPRLHSLEFPIADHPVDVSLYNDPEKPGNVDVATHEGRRASTPPPQPQSEATDKRAISPTTISTLDVISCSFPTKSMRTAAPGASTTHAAHPANPSSLVSNTTDPVAPTPRGLNGKRVHAQPQRQQSHKRKDSLSDFAESVKEAQGTTTEKVQYKSAEFLLTVPYAGSLVRGNLLPPGQAFVEVAPPSSISPSRNTTVFQTSPTETTKYKGQGSAMSGAGMKKLLGSVRRALSTRSPGASSSQSSFLNIAPVGPRGVTTNRLPGTAIVPQARPRPPSGFRPAVRIDILGQEIADDFKKAVREDAGEASSNDIPTKLSTDNIEYSAAHLDSSFELEPITKPRPSSDTAITTGSKSIVIVDDTDAADSPEMTGALGLFNSGVNGSVEAFAESVIPRAANPTPPNTPPNQQEKDIPRRSSYVLHPQAMIPSLSENPLPPFTPDTAQSPQEHPPEDISEEPRPSLERPSLDQGPSQSRHPLSIASYRRHKRQQSSRTFRSKRSVGQRRWASIASTFPESVKSFDATTTYSEGSLVSEIMPPPLRVLRRRPGGDLKGVKNVADLDALGMHQSRSVDSLTTYSESIQSSYLRSPLRESSGFVDVVSSDFSQGRGEVFSLGAMAEKPTKNNNQWSLFSTHSSKPIMRPSFEAEARKLAQIPDDSEDDGGIESALAKLEGKVPQSQQGLGLPLGARGPKISAIAEVSNESATELETEHATSEQQGLPNQPTSDDEAYSESSGPSSHAEKRTTLGVPQSVEVGSFLSEASRESYNSIPLLDRGLSDDGRSKASTQEWTNQSILRDDDDAASAIERPDPSIASPLSYEFIKKTESLERIEPGATIPKSSEESFLDDESDRSSLSSDLSLEVVEADDVGLRPASVLRKPKPSSTITEVPIEANGVHLRPPGPDPSSTPLTLSQALQMSPADANEPRLHEPQLSVQVQKPLPPTPDATPTTPVYQQLRSSDNPVGSKETLRAMPKSDEEPSDKFSVHLPFILAFDSEILAQQFTLIEKDALNEVDWKELIDMRWKNAQSDSRSWVDYLRNSDARGVEVVMARFNIMVKWVISEIVLTQDREERARCIIKFLHIAAHCRRYRNFATMTQIATALTSNEVGRLVATWALVPQKDLKTMQDLETLVSPTKNFVNLREEMEGGFSGTESRCIPFVGIYTQDLLFNAQKPSEIASSPTTAPLVNFERCRIAASVVKTLLRLLEASTLYEFQPIEGITERCLWIGALSDEGIRRHSESLEPPPP